MKRISIIFGTRPETIKLCPLVRAIKDDGHFEAHVCSTGQRRLHPRNEFRRTMKI